MKTLRNGKRNTRSVRKLINCVLLCLAFLSMATERQPSAPIPPLTLNQVIDTCARFYNIPRAVIVGVATLETGMGTAGVGAKYNNLFSIKAYSDWKGEKAGKWRKYKSKSESVEDFCKFITKHYPHLFGRELDRWLLFGYGNSKFEKVGWAQKFNKPM